MRFIFFFLACAFSTLLAAQEVREICPQATPPGWVVISKRLCAGCCGSGMAEMLTIKHIGNDSEEARGEGRAQREQADPRLSRVEVCPQALPPGWVVISSRPCAGCCGSGMAQMLTIERVGSGAERTHREEEHESRHGEADSGVTRTEICPQATPPGWVVIGGRSCAGCCGTEMSRMLTIRRIDAAPKGTRVEMCPQEIPPDWVVVGTRPCAGCCGTTGIDQMVTIEKL